MFAIVLFWGPQGFRNPAARSARGRSQVSYTDHLCTYLSVIWCNINKWNVGLVFFLLRHSCGLISLAHWTPCTTPGRLVSQTWSYYVYCSFAWIFAGCEPFLRSIYATAFILDAFLLHMWVCTNQGVFIFKWFSVLTLCAYYAVIPFIYRDYFVQIVNLQLFGNRCSWPGDFPNRMDGKSPSARTVASHTFVLAPRPKRTCNTMQ